MNTEIVTGRVISAVQNGSNLQAGLTIWLVDDDSKYRELLTEMINYEQGVRCNRCFDSAACVLAVLKSDPTPDVILMDVQMPGMSGLEATPLIGQLVPRTPVVLISAFFNPIHKKQAITSGAVDCLRKTCSVSELLATINTVRSDCSQIIAHGGSSRQID